MERTVCFDLDGTLALVDHRRHFVRSPGKKDWKGFFEACVDDKPNWPIISTLNVFLEQGWDVRIWSGRSDQVETQTVEWLRTKAGIDPHLVPLEMRSRKDYRPDVETKRDMLFEFVTATGRKPELIFDDRDCMVNFWRSQGIVCAQVAPGAF